MDRSTFVYGNERALRVIRPNDDQPRPMHHAANRIHAFEHVNFGSYVFRLKRGVVEEWTDALFRAEPVRVVARVIPEAVVVELDKVDAEIDAMEASLLHLRRARQALLSAALPQCRKARRSDLPSEPT